VIDLQQYLGDYVSPDSAQYADAGESTRVLQAIAATMLSLAASISASDRPRRLQQDFDNLKSASMVLMNITRSEREVSR